MEASNLDIPKKPTLRLSSKKKIWFVHQTQPYTKPSHLKGNVVVQINQIHRRPGAHQNHSTLPALPDEKPADDPEAGHHGTRLIARVRKEQQPRNSWAAERQRRDARTHARPTRPPGKDPRNPLLLFVQVT